MNKINKIILGNFLIEEGSLKKWKLITFLFIMAIIMIFSSHSIDKKIRITKTFIKKTANRNTK